MSDNSFRHAAGRDNEDRPRQAPSKRRFGAPRYLVRWVTRHGEVQEAGARGLPELQLLIKEIEDNDSDLMVAVATFYFELGLGARVT